jgi:hypothetical protein
VRHRLTVLVPVVLLALAAAVPAGAALAQTQATPANCALITPAAATLTLPWQEMVVAGGSKTYCYNSKADCDNAQKQASGTKSACYYDSTKKQYCYDLFFAAAEDPDPVEPPG